MSIAAFADETPVWVKINITNDSYFLWDFQNSTVSNATLEGSNISLKPQATTTVNVYPVFNNGKDQNLTLAGDLNYTLDNSADGCSISIVCTGWNRPDVAGFGCLATRAASATPFASNQSYSTTCNLAGHPVWDPTAGLYTININVNATNNSLFHQSFAQLQQKFD